jgi:hypothetical protein
MAALGIGIVWVAYTTGLYGWCLFKGYDITPKDLLSSTWPPTKFDASKAGAAAGTAIGKVGSDLTGG